MKTRYTVVFANGYQHTESYPQFMSIRISDVIANAKVAHESVYGSTGQVASTEQEDVDE